MVERLGYMQELVARDLSEMAAVDQAPSISGMDMNMTLRPLVATPPADAEVQAEVQAEGDKVPQQEAGS